MSFLNDAKQYASRFARGTKDEQRSYSPGMGGIPAEYMWWGADPSFQVPDEFGDYIEASNPVYSVVSQRAGYLSFLPLRLFKFTGKPALMNVPRSAGEDLLQRIQSKMNQRLVSQSQVRNAIMGMAQAQGQAQLQQYTRQMGMEEIVSGDAYDLLHFVNDFWTTNRLIRMTSMSRDLWGQSYWFVERGPTTKGKPQEIWWVKPTQVRPIPHPILYISHYEFDPLSGGPPIPFYPWEVIRIYNPNPLDEFQALSALSSTSEFADHEMQSMQANTNLHKMGLNPGALVTPINGMVWEEDQARLIEEEVNKRLGGVDKAHRWGTFRQEVKIHQTSVTPRDSEFLGGMAYDLEAVARAYDWPIDLLAGKRTYENVEQAFKRAWQTIVIEAAAVAADIAEFYLPMFGAEEVLVPYFDTSNIAVLQETETARWDREESQIDLVITRNEWRQGRGLPAQEGGDALYVSTQSVPIELVEELGSAQQPLIPGGPAIGEEEPPLELEKVEDEEEEVEAVPESSDNGKDK